MQFWHNVHWTLAGESLPRSPGLQQGLKVCEELFLSALQGELEENPNPSFSAQLTSSPVAPQQAEDGQYWLLKVEITHFPHVATGGEEDKPWSKMRPEYTFTSYFLGLCFHICTKTAEHLPLYLLQRVLGSPRSSPHPSPWLTGLKTPTPPPWACYREQVEFLCSSTCSFASLPAVPLFDLLQVHLLTLCLLELTGYIPITNIKVHSAQPRAGGHMSTGFVIELDFPT